jgi:hypothetical protein
MGWQVTTDGSDDGSNARLRQRQRQNVPAHETRRTHQKKPHRILHARYWGQIGGLGDVHFFMLDVHQQVAVQDQVARGRSAAIQGTSPVIHTVDICVSASR